MPTRKSSWVLFGILVISVWVLGAASQAGAETPKGTDILTKTSGGGKIPGYINYSYDKNTIFFNTASKYTQTVFMDAFWPFDPTVRFLSSDPLVRYELDYKPVIHNGVMMIALPDLQKLYAPFFSFANDGNALTVIHHFFNKRVTAGSGTRTPALEYTKIVTEGNFTIGQTGGSQTSSTYVTVTDSKKIDTAALASKNGPTAVTLDSYPFVRDGVIYVPVANFMKALGKAITAGSGYIVVSSVNPADTTNDLFNPKYNSGTSYPCAAITPNRVTYMNGVLDGTITKGTFWSAFWMGELTVFTGKYDASGKDIMEAKLVNRIIPYRLYVPKGYNPNIPSKFTFLLHGGTGNENAPFERPNDHFNKQPSPLPGVAHDTVENYCDVYNYLVLAPNGWTPSPVWGSGPGEQSLLTAYKLVKSKYNIDTNKIFIMGNSAGGGGTLNFAIRHPEMFKAMSAQAPSRGPGALAFQASAAVNLPLLMVQGTADVTINYKSTVTYYNNNIKGVLRDATFIAIEEGHHSYAWASAYQAIYEFFDRVLEPNPAFDVKEVSFTAGVLKAKQTNSTNQVQEVSLINAPVLAADGTTLMVTLADLSRIYGPEFKYYNVYAYDTDPTKLASVVTIIYNKLSVNIKLGTTFLRAGAALHAGDTTGGSTKVSAGDPSIDPSNLSIPPYTAGGNIYVPVVEFMKLFGKTTYSVRAF